MGTSIETKVVELKFNNDNFAEKINLTREKLEQLNKDIDQVGYTEAFKNLAKSAKDVDVTSISDGVEQVNKSFSKMEIFAVTAMANISNSVVNLGKRIVSSLLDPITKGGLQRAMNIEQATFQFEGMKVGKSAGNEAKSYYEEVMQAVLGTAYSYDVAAKAASQLAASNIGVEKTTRKLADGSKVEAMVMNKDMTKALLGIAGVASMTGSDFDSIAQIFTRVAGQGRVMAMDLNSIASRGLNAAAVLGQALGKTEAEIRDMVSKGEISFQQFSDAMSEAYGSHAKDSTLMFTGALEDVKAALARIGADFYGPALNGARDFLNSLTPLVDVIHERLNPYLEKTNNLLATLSLRGSQALDFLSYSLVKRSGDPNDWIKEHVSSYTNLMDLYNKDTSIVYDAIHGLYQYGLTVGDTTKKIKGFTMIADYLGISVDEVKKGVNEGTIGFNTFYKAFRHLYTQSVELGGLFDPKTGESIGDIFDKYIIGASGAAESTERFKNHFMTINTILDGGLSLWESFKTILSSLGSIVLTLLDHMRPLGTLLVESTKQFAQFTVKMADYIANSKGFGAVIDGVIHVLTKLFDTIRLNQIVPALLLGLSKVFNFMAKVVEVVSNGIAKVATTVSKYIGLFLDKVKEVLSDAQLLNDILNDLKTAGIVVGMIKMANLLLKPLELLEAFTTSVKQTSKGIQGILKGIGDAFSAVAGMFGKIGKVIDEVTTAIKRMQELLVATAILEIAAAIAVLAAALYLLSKVDVQSAADALVPLLDLGGIVGALMSIMLFVQKHSRELEDLKDVGEAFRNFAISIGIIAVAIYALAKIDQKQLIGAVAAIEVIMVTMAVMAKMLTNTTESISLMSVLFGRKKTSQITKGLKGLISMAVAIRIIASAITKLASISDPAKLYNGLAVIEALLFSMTGIVKLLSGDKATKMAKGTTSLIAMAAAIRLLAKPLIELSAVDSDSLWSTTALVAGLMTSMALLVKVMSGAKGSIKNAASILIMVEAIKVLKNVLVELSAISSDSVWSSVGVLALSIAGLVTALNLLDADGALTKAITLLAVAKMLKVLSDVIISLGVAGDSAWVGLGAMALGLTTLWMACKAFEKVKLGGIAKLFLVLMSAAVVAAAFGAAIGVIGLGLSMFGAGIASLAGGLKELKGLIEPFVAVIGMLTVAIVALSTVGLPAIIVILALGAAFTLFGVGMQKMGEGLQNAAQAITYIAKLRQDLVPTSKAIVEFVERLSGMTHDAEKIGNSLSKISEPFKQISKSVKSITEDLKSFEETYNTLIGNLSGYMDKLITSLTALQSFNAESFGNATKSIRTFIDDLGNVMNDALNVSSRISEMATVMGELKTQIQSVSDAFESLENHGIYALGDLGTKLAGIAEPINSLNNLRSSLDNIANDLLEFIQNLTKMKDSTAVVSASAAEIQTALDSVATAAENAKTQFGAFTQDTANILSMMGQAFTDIANGTKDIVAVQDDLPGAAAAIQTFYNSLSKLSGLAVTITEATNAVANAVVALGNSAKRAVKLSLGDLDKTGEGLVNMIIKGINKKQTDAGNALQKIVDHAHNKVKSVSNYNNWKGIGSYLIKGLVQGIKSQQDELESEVSKLEAKAERAVKAKARIKSPSRVWMQLGSYMGQGLAIGISNTSPMVSKAAVQLGSVSEEAVTNAIASINQAINDDMSLNPVITPVIDLSNIKDSADYINSAFGSAALGLSGAYGSRLASAINTNIQNGGIEDAINDLTDKIEGMTETMNNRQLNVYNNIDGATDPSLLADQLVRSFRLKARTV